MEDWITVITFTFPSESYVPRSVLESEGIEVFMKDELTAQVHNFYSNAIGGVKLMVRKDDARRAYEILKEAGFIK